MEHSLNAYSQRPAIETPSAMRAEHLAGKIDAMPMMKAASSHESHHQSKLSPIVFDRHEPLGWILCTGHSYWFRAFFQTYLPSNFQHVCKTKKLVNGGMIGFTLCHTKVKATGEDKYMIDPTSLTVLYAGF